MSNALFLAPITRAVDLYWMPLSAGGYFVRFNGRAYEAVAARMARPGRRATSTTRRSKFDWIPSAS